MASVDVEVCSSNYRGTPYSTVRIDSVTISIIQVDSNFDFLSFHVALFFLTVHIAFIYN